MAERRIDTIGRDTSPGSATGSELSKSPSSSIPESARSGIPKSSKQLLAVATGLAFAGGLVAIFNLDSTGWRHNWDLPGDITKAINLSEAFAHGFGVLAILGTLLVVAADRRQAIWCVVLITATSGLLANGLKSCFVRIRPHASESVVVAAPEHLNQGVGFLEEGSGTEQAANQKEVIEASFWDARQRSFPSGHAATAWGLAIGLSLVYRRGTLAFVILAVMASLQRLTSGAHYPTDVLAGAAIAFACAGVILWQVPFARRLCEKQPMAEAEQQRALRAA